MKTNSVDSFVNQAARDAAAEDRASAATDRTRSAADRKGRTFKGHCGVGVTTDSAQRMTANQYSSLRVAHDRDLQAQERDEIADDRDAWFAANADSGEVRFSTKAAALDREMSRRDRRASAHDRKWTLKLFYSPNVDQFTQAQLKRDSAARTRDRAAGERDLLADARDQIADGAERGLKFSLVFGFIPWPVRA